VFPELFAKPAHVIFDEPASTSDGGALLLKAADERLQLTERLAACFRDDRQAGKVKHAWLDVFRQRVYGWALGYPDGNDVARVGEDPMHKLLLGRDPLEGESLASQPTLSRFENAVCRTDLYRASEELVRCVLERAKTRRKGKGPRHVTIDLDGTSDATHGGQQMAFFNGYYGEWCYQPLPGFLTFDHEPEQHLVAAVLRPGNAAQNLAAVPVLQRLIRRIREYFPQATIRVRLDAGFACPELFSFLDRQRRLEYVVALQKNSVLAGLSESLLDRARRQSERREQSVALYGEHRYRARKWKRDRRMVFKAEVLRYPGREPKDNPRFVATNLRHKPETVYRIYCQRGDSENRIKELKVGLAMDRTSCTSFWANQLRVLMAAAAFVLFQELRSRLRHTKLARAQVDTLRLALLRIGARIERSVRRIVVHLVEAHPWQRPWLRAARALGAAARV
jgi:hypothetical protein